ncbi:MAG: co-chaperone DjlA [Porticoccaceae bacterium]|nr:co-chaperone DjlA [Porticoccaceae bacterium]MDG1473629.1 co-chaperone DjlA [Porticoccaceae bacterium]
MLGKIIGGIFGFMLGWGAFGAILGIYIGHQFDRGVGGFSRPLTAAQQQLVQDSFFKTVFSLLGHVAKADGRVSSDEIAQAEVLMDKMRLDSGSRRKAIELFKAGSSSRFSIDNTLQEFMSVCGRYNNLKRQLLNYLISLAMADGTLDQSEQQVLKQVAQNLGFSAALFEQLIQMIKAQSQFRGSHTGGGRGQSSQNQLADAYKAIGVTADDSDGNIKKAYRKLVSQNHPDKLIGQGMPEDMINLATEKTQEIQAAYELIIENRK